MPSVPKEAGTTREPVSLEESLLILLRGIPGTLGDHRGKLATRNFRRD